jgi:hypothetical protein
MHKLNTLLQHASLLDIADSSTSEQDVTLACKYASHGQFHSNVDRGAAQNS